MTFPNKDKGPFEDENGAWCQHVTHDFLQNTTMPMLASPGTDAAHCAVAHLNGAIICLMVAAGGHETLTISPELLTRCREFMDCIESGFEGVDVKLVDQARPHLTVLQGGKPEDPT